MSRRATVRPTPDYDTEEKIAHHYEGVSTDPKGIPRHAGYGLCSYASSSSRSPAVFWTASNQTNVTPPFPARSPPPVCLRVPRRPPQLLRRSPRELAAASPLLLRGAPRPHLLRRPKRRPRPSLLRSPPRPHPLAQPKRRRRPRLLRWPPTSTAPTFEKEDAAPSVFFRPRLPRPPNEAAPPSSPAQPAASIPTAQTAEKESAPASAPSPASAPAAPAGEKAPAATEQDAEPHANDKASAELAALQPGFVPKDLVAALNDSVIKFRLPTSADKPASAPEFPQKAAEDLRQLREGATWWMAVRGLHPDNTGGSRNAQRRALRKRVPRRFSNMLIKFGADPKMLIASKVDGRRRSMSPATRATPEGWRRNRQQSSTISLKDRPGLTSERRTIYTLFGLSGGGGVRLGVSRRTGFLTERRLSVCMRAGVLDEQGASK